MIKRIIQNLRDRRSVAQALDAGAPESCRRAFRLLAGQRVDYSDEEQRIFAAIDERRQATAQLKRGDIDIYYSPKPNSATDPQRPEHGEVKQFAAARIASHTSISDYWGRFLHLLAHDSRAATILELGSCAGISGCYLSSPPSCRAFHTIEASADLCEIARDNIAEVSDKATVHNGLFDDVLDTLLPQLGERSIDLIWIDGHHEKVATLHYFRRVRPYLKPGAIVLLDDIGWSQDMRECWEEFIEEPGLSQAWDLKTLKGMAIWQADEGKAEVREIARPLGPVRVGEPQGWND